MAELKWAIPCLRAITDRESNNVTYVDTIEQLQIPQVPFLLPPFVVGTAWERDSLEEHIEMRVRIVDPENNILGEINGNLHDPTYLRHRANFTFMVPTTSIGRHRVLVEQRVRDGWHLDAEIAIDVAIDSAIETINIPIPEAAAIAADRNRTTHVRRESAARSRKRS
jgi:hypothetical protein